jgi:chromosome condensin MukBEF ATPase and DNA-binding subunit MukB
MSRLAALAVVTSALLALLSGGASGGRPQLRVAFVTDVLPAAGSHDFRVSMLAGFRRAVRDFGIHGRIVQLGPRQGAATTFVSLARQKYDLILVGRAPFVSGHRRGCERRRALPAVQVRHDGCLPADQGPPEERAGITLAH